MRPGRLLPTLDCRLVTFFGLRGGPLQRPAHLTQQLPDMSRVVTHPSGLLDHLGDARQSPEIRRVAIGAGSTHQRDRKSTRLNSSHVESSYAVFCLKKKNAA